MSTPHRPQNPLSATSAGRGPATESTPPPAKERSWGRRLLVVALLASLAMNYWLFTQWQQYVTPPNRPTERFHSGSAEVEDRIAIVSITGPIMPPFTDRTRRAIRRAIEDDRVKGVLLSIDSPGGLVADSHQIYHELQQLRKKKPVFVAMKRLAASGGIYVAMGAGPEAPIFVEPTTWTGSIGVIIPRYDLTEASQRLGIEAEPLKTGEFKDSLSPFRELTERERELWNGILNDAFERFIQVIADNRQGLDVADVRELATGRLFTAEQALENGLADRMGYEEDAIDALKEKLALSEVRVVKYETDVNLLGLLLGSVRAEQEEPAWNRLLEATVPRAMYYCNGAIPPIVSFREQ